VSELRDVIREGVKAGMIEQSQCLRNGSVKEIFDSTTESVIAAIGDSGRVVVDRARFERLLALATKAVDMMNERWDTDNLFPVEDGDLEPLP